MLDPKLTSFIGIESIISVGLVHLLEIKEHCIRIEFTVDPTGVKVDNTSLEAVAWVDGKVPEANPMIVLIDPVDAKTNCGVYAVVGNPVPDAEYNPEVGRVYVPIPASVGTK